jgi:hypothetical protein
MNTETTPATTAELLDELARLRSRNLRMTERIREAAGICHAAKAGGRVGIVKADVILRALDAH